MEIRTALTLAIVLCIALWVPYFIFYIAGEGARTHVVHMVEAAGSLRHRPGRWGARPTRPGADDARGARY